MGNELRQTFRRLRLSPGFTVATLLTLGLGIGASTAVFSVVHGVLLRALPVPQPEQVVFITRTGDVSIPDGEDWRRATPALDSVALFLRDWSFDLVGEGEPERLRGGVVEPQYFRVLGVEPLLGRTLTAEDNRAGGPRVAVISESLWRSRFAADPAIVGRSIRLSDHPTTILGVMPARFDVLGDGTALWVPVAIETPWALAERGTNNFDAIGRLRPGATLGAAQSELLAISQRLEREYPRTNRGKIVRPILLLDFLVGNVRKALWVLFGAVLLVLLIACANLGSLMLARAAGRRRDVALRSALGATGGRIIRPLLLEGLVLAVGGGALGLALAFAGGPALARMGPAELPRASAVLPDLPVFLFGCAAALLCGLLCSLGPAWRTLRIAPAAVLQESGRGTAGTGRRGRDLRHLLVALEVALAFVLALGAQQLGRSFLALAALPLGFDPAGVLTAELVLPEARYADREAQTRAFRALVAAMRGIPGVENAAAVIGAPLRDPGRGIGSTIEIDGYTSPDGAKPAARVRTVMGDYFRGVRAPLLRGRLLTDADDEHAAPVLVVNERFASTYWPGQDAVGKRVRFSGWDDTRWFSVVGVVADQKSSELARPDTRALYLPYAQRGPAWQRFGTLLVRTGGDPRALGRALREAVWRVDPALTLGDMEALVDRQARASALPRFLAEVLGAFALAAVFLVVQGLYSLLSFLVAQRKREIGIRMALGASARGVAAATAGQGLRAALAGALAGLAVSLGLRPVLAGLLFQVSPVDGWSLAGALALLLLATLAATARPALRAARVDPMVALREE